MTLALALLLAQVQLAERDLCEVVKSVLRAAPNRFQSVRGAKEKRVPGKLQYLEPLKLPLAASCKVVVYDDGSQPFYGCEMHARSCKLTEKQFEKMRDELAGCVGKPTTTRDEEKKRQVRFKQSNDWYVRLVFNRAKSCGLLAMVEK